MKLTKEELMELYRQRAARTARRREECLNQEAIERMATDEWSPAERERIADHLAACSDCAEEYRLMHALKFWAQQVATSVGEPAPEAPVRSGLHGEGASDRAPQAWWSRLGAALSPARIPYAIAALLGIVSLALGVWNLSLHRRAARLNDQLAERNLAIVATASLPAVQRQLEETSRRSQPYEIQMAELRQALNALAQPQLNVPIVDLDPRDSFLRGPSKGSVRTIEVPAGANVFTLILNVVGQPSYTNYALEIRDAHSQLVWRGPGLHKSPYDTFTVALPRLLIPAGQYRIKLYGLRGDRQELVEDYAVRIQYRS